MKHAAVLGVCVVIAFGLGLYLGKRSSDSAGGGKDVPIGGPSDAPSLSAIPPNNGLPTRRIPVAHRIVSETEEILAAAIPGETNQVLIDKMRGALDEPDKYKRAAHWQTLLSLMRKEDIDAVHQLWPENDAQGKWHHIEFEAYWAQRGIVDPEGALDQIKGDGFMTRGPHRYNVINSWAQSDGPAALARALGENEAGERASDLLSGAISGWATHDPEAATEALMTDVPEGERMRIIGSMAWSVVYSGGVEEAQKWFAELGEQNFEQNPALVKLAYNTLAEAVARGGGDATAEFMVAQAEQPWFDRAPLDRVLSNWSQAGPQRVLEMIERLPPEEENLRWIDRAAGSWTDVRENALGNWLIDNPDSPIYDRVTAAFSKQIRSVDPNAARAWMETIEDPGLKQTVEEILGAL